MIGAKKNGLSPRKLDALISAQTEGQLCQKDQEMLIVERHKGHVSDQRITDIIAKREKLILTAKQIDDILFQRHYKAKILDKFIVQSYGVLTLYRNDLDELFRLFQLVASDVTIVLSDYTIGTTADIVKIRGRRANYLSITSTTPNLALELRSNSAIFSIECADTPDLLIFATGLHDLLLSKQGIHLPYFFAVLMVPVLERIA